MAWNLFKKNTSDDKEQPKVDSTPTDESSTPIKREEVVSKIAKPTKEEKEKGRQAYIKRNAHRTPKKSRIRTSLRGGASKHSKMSDDAVSRCLQKPCVTEKAAALTEKNIYTFFVSSDSTKAVVSQAIETKYKVKPSKIRMVKVPRSPVRLRHISTNRLGSKGGGKKAYVYLNQGDKIKLS